MATKTDKIYDAVITVKEDVAGIKQHLKDINGKLVKHDTFLSEECPKRHTDFAVAISKNNTKLILIGTGIAIVCSSGLAYVLHLLG